MMAGWDEEELIDPPLFGRFDSSRTQGFRSLRLPWGGYLCQFFDGNTWTTMVINGSVNRTMMALKNVGSAASDLAQQPSTQVVAATAIGGAVTTGAAGAVVGSATGGTVGLLVGVVAAPLTFGLSIPVGTAIGSCTGLFAGAAGGAATGAAGGGLLGLVGFRCASALGIAPQTSMLPSLSLTGGAEDNASEDEDTSGASRRRRSPRRQSPQRPRALRA